MSGLAGVLNLSGEPVSPLLIQRMTDAIAHRGPDGEGYYTEANLAIGHRHLRVFDRAASIRNPLLGRDRMTALAFDGTILNFHELRQSLEDKGNEFQTHADTEILLYGYREEGIDFIRRINGAFALALWDARQKRLYLTRDRYGMKPLYYWFDGNTLLFASEIKAILTHPNVSAALHLNGLNEYFTFQNLLQENTLFQGIYLVPAGTIIWMNESDRLLHRQRYWNFDFTHPLSSLTLEEAAEESASLTERAVKRSLLSDAPLGGYLFADSIPKSLVSLASRYMPFVYTFTFGFHQPEISSGEPPNDDRAEAEMTAHAFKTEHYGMVINSTDIQRSLPRVVYHLEDLRLGMSYHDYYLARLASKFVRACLAPHGGNELFARYPWRYYHTIQKLNQDDYIRQYYDSYQHLVSDREKSALFTEDLFRNVSPAHPYEQFRDIFLTGGFLQYDSPEEQIAGSLYFECKTFLHGSFLLSDRISSAHGIQLRYPYMDNEFVDYCQTIPIRLHLGDLTKIRRIDENVLRKLRFYRQQREDERDVFSLMMKSIIPPQLAQREKLGVATPDEIWFRGKNLPYVRDILLNPRAASRDYLRSAFLHRIVEEHAAGTKNHRLLIWALLCFEWWCKIFLEKYPV